ncbi:MAG: inorganic phosphate transporter [Acidobacteriota bacterium]
MDLFLAISVGLLLAYANGANDNFKGVATLLGSATTSYRRALVWATITTLAGSMTALIVARGLLAAFSGKGLVPPQLVADPRFSMAVALAAGVTVLLATRFGFPISTTHALIGGLIGAGTLASPTGINLTTLGSGFVLPLLASPFIAILAVLAVYPPLSYLRSRFGIQQETCLCVGTEVVAVVPATLGAAQAITALTPPTISAGTTTTCRVRYQGRFLGISARPALDAAHYLSAGMVGFARGLNDTPKIAALLLAGKMLAPSTAIVGVAVAIGIGGLLSARRVAETMSHRITAMNPGQGFVANIVTGLLVVGASKLGLPVSTTHVSCGSLFGIGAATWQPRWKIFGEILLAWIVTLPVAAILGALAISALR